MNQKTPHHPTSGICSLNPFSTNFCRNCALQVAARRCTNATWDIDRQNFVWEQKIKPFAGSKVVEVVDDSSSDLSERLVDWQWVQEENNTKHERRDREHKVTEVPKSWKLEGKKKPMPEPEKGNKNPKPEEKNKEELDEWQLEWSDNESAENGSKELHRGQEGNRIKIDIMARTFHVRRSFFG
jgi:hypothetical protein